MIGRNSVDERLTAEVTGPPPITDPFRFDRIGGSGPAVGYMA